VILKEITRPWNLTAMGDLLSIATGILTILGAVGTGVQALKTLKDAPSTGQRPLKNWRDFEFY
jgi:hypothetical protein